MSIVTDFTIPLLVQRRLVHPTTMLTRNKTAASIAHVIRKTNRIERAEDKYSESDLKAVVRS
jgi:hypothetical protein